MLECNKNYAILVLKYIINNLKRTILASKIKRKV